MRFHAGNSDQSGIYIILIEDLLPVNRRKREGKVYIAVPDPEYTRMQIRLEAYRPLQSIWPSESSMYTHTSHIYTDTERELTFLLLLRFLLCLRLGFAGTIEEEYNPVLVPLR